MNPGLLDEKGERYLCAMQPPFLEKLYSENSDCPFEIINHTLLKLGDVKNKARVRDDWNDVSTKLLPP